MYATPRNGDALVSRSAGLVGNGHETLLVQALYPYSYEMQPGREVSFEAGECFILVEKSNDDWWHVKKGEQDLYVPANYMTESCIDFSDSDTTDSLGENCTLSPSSEDSYQDIQDETANLDEEERTTFGREDSERIYMNVNDISGRIYANIPVKSNGQEPSMRRHYSTGEDCNQANEKAKSERYRPKSATLPAGWSMEVDNESGRTFYFNNKTNESTWRPPSTSSTGSESQNDTSRSLPRGWRLERQAAVDEYMYINESNNEKWQSSKDEAGRTYYYNTNGETVWELPTSDSNELLQPEPDEGQRSPSEYRSSLIIGDEFPLPPTLPALDYSIKKEGTINRKKLCEKGGKKVKKTWSPCYVKLSSANMIMYKNQSAAQPKPGFTHGQPDSSCDLRGAVIQKMPDENKRRNIMQIATVAKLCFLLQVDDVHEFSVWYHMIADVVKYLEENEPVDNGMQARLYGDIVQSPRPAPPPPPSAALRGSLKKARSEGDKKNIKDRLKKLMTRRPTIEELQKKGILKDITFGCHIMKLCAREQTKVPKVVVGCIEAIENKGLDFDGLYRISGNVSSIQQLRITVDQEENVEFGERPFDDVHVLSGTLKLYFRELPEPLIPFDAYDQFVDAIKSPTKLEKTKALQNQVNKLPSPNRETFRYLYRHLKRVMENSSKNRMHAHNIAIVFGPTLLAPREEQHGNIAVNTVYQNQIVEFILLEYDQVLGKDS
ncbi:rho GTPase-activating protein 15-like isoform X2 [Dendronephthya gigantea]|uniref:rho GTPase-activating protein 15-like isoform X2 n=1 Tax=Dendronephthya gigantea TaxID=151771 RepID=UPI00106BB569|nr:rho GTPase-activating protein 15-like isoform X2 [Dendronephthya gigantea]